MPTTAMPSLRKCTAIAAFALATLALSSLSDQAFAQSDWQPFKEKDERAARNRQLAPPPPPALPSVEPGDLNRPYGAPPFPAPPGQLQPGVSQPHGSRPYFRPSTVEPGSPKIESVELPPIDPAQQPPVPAQVLQNPSMLSPRPALSSPALSIIGVQSSQQRPASATKAVSQELWRGVDMRQLEALVGPLDVPPKSLALHGLWTRLLTADANPPAGGQGPSHYLALQLEALYRSGLTGAMNERLARATAAPDDPLITAFSIRLALSDGDSAKACEGTRRLAAKRSTLPKLLNGEVHVLSGYCAAVQGNTAGAGLAADLAREDEVEAPFALQVMDAIGAGRAGKNGAAPKDVKLSYPKRLSVLEYRLLELLGSVDPQAVLTRAEPALLSAIANADNTDPRLTLSAAEAAAASHALAPEGLAEVYATLKLPANAGSDPFFRRAALFKSMAAEPDGARKLQIARQLIDDARRSGFGLVMARTLARPLATIGSLTTGRSGPETGPPIVTPQLGAPQLGAGVSVVAIETAIAAGDFARARQLVSGQPEAQAWLALVDIADPRTERVSDGALAAVDGLARQGRFEPVALHRLVTVLDALDVNVPIPLWETANRTQQPTAGFLPETGTLPQLQEAARRGEIGRTALLVMRTIGSDGPDKSHLIGLGDAIRALRRVGLEADARALALEALYADWPRGR